MLKPLLILVIAMLSPLFSIGQYHMAIYNPPPLLNCIDWDNTVSAYPTGISIFHDTITQKVDTIPYDPQMSYQENLKKSPERKSFFNKAKANAFAYFNSHCDFRADTCYSDYAYVIRLYEIFKTNKDASHSQKKKFREEHLKYAFNMSIKIHTYLRYDITFLLDDSLNVVEAPEGLRSGAKKIWSIIDLTAIEDTAKKYNDSLYSNISAQHSDLYWDSSLKIFVYSLWGSQKVVSSKSTEISYYEKIKASVLLLNANTGKVIKETYGFSYPAYRKL